MTIVVLSIYSKSGGKNGKHAYTPQAENISGVSYMSVQVFEQSSGVLFNSIPRSLRWLGAHKFAHLPSTMFLRVLDHTPLEERDIPSIKLRPLDLEHFVNLKTKRTAILAALKELNGRKTTEVLEDDDD